MKKHFIFLILFSLLSSHLLFSQKVRPNYQLLWKITGPGLKKPSYLFGTMHLRDKRVFDFSDSVLVKLEECETFAMECTPDSMLAAVFSMLMEEEETNDIDLKSSLSDEEYNKLESKLKIEGIDIRKLRNKSPRKIIKLLSTPIAEKGGKETFLDAYLYRIAKENKKNVVGLENISDYDDLFKKDNYEKDIKELKSYIHYQNAIPEANLIDIYWQGDIGKIEQFYSGADSTFLENLLYKRNYKMRDKMINLMKDKSSFVAVGAGHLPGEKGLIQLLRDKGFTVTQVKASFTGLASKYKEKTLETDWIRFNEEDHLYSAEFPSQPFLYNSKNTAESKVYIYPDLATGLFYYSISFPMAKLVDEDPNVLLDQYMKGLSRRGEFKVASKKKINFKGYHAIDATLINTSNGLHMKVTLVVRRSSLYALMLGAFDQALLASKDADRFLQSLELKGYKNSTWQTFKNEDGAFSINSPFELKKSEQNVNGETGKVAVKMFSTTDQNKGIGYFVAYYNFAPGTVITDDSLYITTAIEHMAQSKGKIVESNNITLDGYPGKEFIFSVKDNVYIKGRIVLRGTRPYIYFVVTSQDKLAEKEVTDFVESFELLEFKKSTWNNYESNKYQFTINIPGKMSIDSDTLTKRYSNPSETFNCFNYSSGNSYVVMVQKFGRYEFMTKDEYFKEQKETYVGTEDSLLWSKDVTINGVSGKDMLILLKKSHNVKRILVLPKGDYQYNIFAFLPKRYVETKETNDFFGSFKFTDKSTDASIFKSHSKEILADLSSNDSATFDKAKMGLYSYKFTTEDLPLIYQTLRGPMKDDSNANWNSRYTLISKFEKVHDKTTVPFIKEQFQKADTNINLKIRIIEPLLSIGSDEAIATFISLSKEKSLESETAVLHYSYFQPLKDSLAYNKKLLPQIFELYRNKSFRNGILEVASILLDSNGIDVHFFDPYKNELVAIATENLDLKNYKEDEKYTYYRSNVYLIQFLSKVSQDNSIAKVLELASLSKNIDISFVGLKGQITNNYTLDPKTISNVATDNSYRLDLYKAMKEKNKESQFPIKLKTQSSLGESSLYNYLMNVDDYYPTKITVAGNKIMEYKGKPQKFYLYKVNFGEKEWYPGVVGPYSIDQKEINTEPQVIKLTYDPYTSKNINEYYQSAVEEKSE